MQEKKRITLGLAREYIEMNIRRYTDKERPLSEDEDRWFASQLVQLEQAEALQRIADALEKIASSYPKL